MEKYVIYQRSSDRDYDDVRKVGEAANEIFAKSILSDYAARCSCVTMDKSGLKFHACIPEGADRIWIDAWAVKV